MSTKNRNAWFGQWGLVQAIVLSAGVLWAGSLAAAPVLVAATAPDPAHGGVGQEMKSLEKNTRDTQAPAAKPDPDAAKKLSEQKAVMDATKAPAAPEVVKKDGFKVTRVEVRGDVEFLKGQRVLDPLRGELEGKILTPKEIVDITRRYNQMLVQRGFYLVTVSTVSSDAASGLVVVSVDQGRTGKMTFYQRGAKGRDQKIPYNGKYFSEAQLRTRLANLQPGSVFDYNVFYRGVSGINTHPDLIMDTDLRIRTEEGPAGSQRYADMDFYVREKIPLHAILSVANSGTKATGDWRPSLTLQDLNLTRHDDVLTLNAGPISTDGESLKSGAASYYLPYSQGKGGAFTLYGGYSELDSKDVVEGIDLKGKGWFTGIQGSKRVIATERHAVSLSLGVVYRDLQEQLILSGEGTPEEALQTQEVELLPFIFGVTYATVAPDKAGGRNFLTSETSANFEGLVTDQQDIETIRAGADATYVIERLQVARLQPVSFSRLEKPGRWLVFGKLDGQLAGVPLVPAEQKALGGMDNVRGFPERVVQGDDGINGTLELRTPLLTDVLSSPFRSKASLDAGLKEGKAVDRLQFVTFADAGYVQIQEAQDQNDSYTLTSVGVGFRLQMTPYSQLRIDYGVPLSYDDSLKDGEDGVESSGRVHLSAQVQF